MSTGLIWILLVILIIVLIFIFVGSRRLYLADDLPLVGSAVDPFNISNGDILTVGYQNAFGRFVTACTGSLWTHTGVAWRSPETGELFIFEQARYDDKYTGVYRIPFDLWLRINRKHHICHLKLQGAPLDPYLMDKICKDMETIKTTMNADFGKYFITTPYIDDPAKKNYTCYEVTTLLLQRLGVVQKKLSCGAYFPGRIVSGGMHMEPGYSYDPPVLLSSKRIPV